MAPGSLVRFESLYTKGRYFTARVVSTDKQYAIIEDERKRWPKAFVALTRLEYVKPVGKFR